MRYFKNLFKKNRHHERNIKAYFIQYFEPTADSYIEELHRRVQYIIPLCQLQITDIQVYTSRKLIEMVVTLCKPGLLIGMQGKTIDSVTNYIQSRVEKPFKITIKESKLWQ